MSSQALRNVEEEEASQVLTRSANTPSPTAPLSVCRWLKATWLHQTLPVLCWAGLQQVSWEVGPQAVDTFPLD